MRVRGLIALVGGCVGAVPAARAQATIDTVIVVSRNVFDPPGRTPRFVARLGNALHITTHPGVVRRLLLLDAGARIDSPPTIQRICASVFSTISRSFWTAGA